MRAACGLLVAALAPAPLQQGAREAASGPGESAEWLSDRPDLLAAHHQSWGQLGLDVCAHAPGQRPLELAIGGRRYAKGLGSHANGEIVVELDGGWSRFEATVGVQKQDGGIGSVVFQVFADERELFRSPVLRESDPPLPVSVDLGGALELRLVVTDAGDGITCDCGNWAQARLVRPEGAPAPAPRRGLDVAPFAEVRSWDWRQIEGTRAGRTEEFPEADLHPWSEPARDAAGVLELDPVEGFACVGLEWLAPRRLASIAIELADDAIAEGARVEQWIGGAGGGSTWQGRWAPLRGELRAEGQRLELEPARDDPAALRGTAKIRWVLPARPAAPRVARLAAISRSRWKEVELLLTAAPTSPPVPPPVPSPPPSSRASGSLTLWNGVRRDGGTGPLPFDLERPLRLALVSCASRHARADRTLLQVAMHGQRFAIAVEDVLARGGVWVAEAGLWVTDGAQPLPFEEYLRGREGRRTILAEVRARPDASLAAAMDRLHDPRQDRGPTLLSLPSHNGKFVVERDGTVRWDDRAEVVDCVDRVPSEGYRCAAVVRFGEERAPADQRSLAHPDLLALELRRQEGPVAYSTAVLVATVEEPPASLADGGLDLLRRAAALGELLLAAENGGAEAADALFDVQLSHPSGVRVGSRAGAATVVDGEGRVLAWIVAGRLASIEPRADGCRVRAALAPGGRVECRVLLPGWRASPSELARVPDAATTREHARRAWALFLSEMAQFDLPDRELDRLIDASVLHCLAAARAAEAPRAAAAEAGSGPQIAPWIASVHYGPLESEAQAVIRGMQALGARSFAEACHRYFSTRVDGRGLLTTGYTVMSTGWHLWTLGEYDRLFEDDATLRELAPSVVRACRWVMAQRRKTMRPDRRGGKPPEHGLLPPGPLADWDVCAFYFYANANYCAGLRDAAAALARIGDPAAAEIAADAESFQADLLRAFRIARSRAPVVPLRDGRFVPYYPAQVHHHGPMEELHPGADGGRSWCYDVELGASHLVALGLLEPDSREADSMVEHLEDVQFLRDGWFAWPAAENARDPWLHGGFAKVQPYYARTVETHAARDDVAPFLRSFFHTIPTLLNREDLSLWEHFAASGAWNKTHETGYLLHQARTLLLTERGQELWLAPFLPRAWLADGARTSVRNAPTSFGPVSFAIASHVADGFIAVAIDPPRRRPPAALVLRLRHPDSAPLRAVTVNGRGHRDLDREAGTIRLPPSTSLLAVRASY